MTSATSSYLTPDDILDPEYDDPDSPEAKKKKLAQAIQAIGSAPPGGGMPAPANAGPDLAAAEANIGGGGSGLPQLTPPVLPPPNTNTSPASAPSPALGPMTPPPVPGQPPGMMAGLAALASGGPPPPNGSAVPSPMPPPGLPQPPGDPQALMRQITGLAASQSPAPVHRPDLGPGGYSVGADTHSPTTMDKISRIVQGIAGGLGGGMGGYKRTTDSIDNAPFNHAQADYNARDKARLGRERELAGVMGEQDKLNSSTLTQSLEKSRADAILGAQTSQGIDLPGIGHIPGTTESDARKTDSAANVADSTAYGTETGHLRAQIEGQPRLLASVIAATKAKLDAAGIQPTNPMYNAEMAKALGIPQEIEINDVLTAAGVHPTPGMKGIKVEAKEAAGIIEKIVAAKVAGSARVDSASIAAGVAAGMGGGGGSLAGGPADTWAQRISAGQATLAQVPMKLRTGVLQQLDKQTDPNIPQHFSPAGKEAMKSITLSEHLVDSLLPNIAAHKDEKGVSSRIGAQMGWWKYQLGLGNAADDEAGNMGDDMKQLTSLLGVASIKQYLGGIRRYEFVKKIENHLPKPEYTPAANYQRLKEMKEVVLPELKSAMMAAETGSSTGGGGFRPMINGPAAPKPKVYNPTTGKIE